MYTGLGAAAWDGDDLVSAQLDDRNETGISV